MASKRNPPDKVYLIRADINGDVEYKIGCTSRTPQHRIAEMRTSNPADMSVVATYVTQWARELEGVLHKHYVKHRLSNEWFYFPEGITLEDFVQQCERHERALSAVLTRGVFLFNPGAGGGSQFHLDDFATAN